MNDTDSQENTLMDVALKHKHEKCVEYMKIVEFRNRCRGFSALRKYSYIFKLIVKLVQWKNTASLRLKPYKLNTRKRAMIAKTSNMHIMDDAHNMLISHEISNVLINKSKCQKHPTTHDPLKTATKSIDSNILCSCYSKNTSPVNCKLSTVSSLPSINSSSVFDLASGSAPVLTIASSLTENKNKLTTTKKLYLTFRWKYSYSK